MKRFAIGTCVALAALMLSGCSSGSTDTGEASRPIETPSDQSSADAQASQPADSDSVSSQLPTSWPTWISLDGLRFKVSENTSSETTVDVTFPDKNSARQFMSAIVAAGCATDTGDAGGNGTGYSDISHDTISCQYGPSRVDMIIGAPSGSGWIYVITWEPVRLY